MRARSLLLLLALVAIAAFAVLNWVQITETTHLSLGFAEVQAPLGLVLLAMLVALSFLFLVFVVWIQGGAMVEGRRQAKALAASREMADKAEASRLAELKAALETGLVAQAARTQEAESRLLARLNAMEATLKQQHEESANGTAAAIGELEDRLERNGRLPPPAE